MLLFQRQSLEWVSCILVACAFLPRLASFPTSQTRDGVKALSHSLQNLRFSDSWKYPSRQSRSDKSFLEAGNTCTLPPDLKIRSVASPALVDMLKSHKPFTYVRFGDGDWYCALGGNGPDSNGVVLDKVQDMCDTLQSDIKHYGLKPDANFFAVVGSFFICKERSMDLFSHVEAWLANGPLRPDFSGFLDSNAVGFYFPLVPPKEAGRPRGVLPLLENQVVVLVGPKHLSKLHTMLNYTAFVEVPPTRCWESRDQITLGITQESKRHPKDAVVFLVAGGIAARTMLYKTFLALGQKDTFIDVGASLDGFAGIASRDYNKDVNQFCVDYPEYAVSGACGAPDTDKMFHRLDGSNAKANNAQELVNRPKVSERHGLRFNRLRRKQARKTESSQLVNEPKVSPDHHGLGFSRFRKKADKVARVEKANDMTTMTKISEADETGDDDDDDDDEDDEDDGDDEEDDDDSPAAKAHHKAPAPRTKPRRSKAHARSDASPGETHAQHDPVSPGTLAAVWSSMVGSLNTGWLISQCTSAINYLNGKTSGSSL